MTPAWLDMGRDAPVLALLAIVVWLALLWNAACYGAGWCQWSDPRCALDANGINTTTGTWRAPAGVSCHLEVRP